MSALKPRAAAVAAAPTPISAFGDDILREIFLRLRGAPCLACAALTCKRWLAVVRDAAFLRRFRLLHSPPSVDFIVSSSLSAPHLPVFFRACRAAVAGNGFAMDYLPDGSWSLADLAGGLALLHRHSHDHTVAPGFAVCNPLSRSFTLIPPPPAGVITGVTLGAALLVNHGDPFSVLCAFHDGAHPVACVFSSNTNDWTVLTRAADIGLPPANVIFVGMRAGGRIYWKMELEDRLLSLDIATAIFSTIVLPHGMAAGHFWSMRAMVTEDNHICIVALAGAGLVLRSWIWVVGADVHGWVLDKEVPLHGQLASLTGDGKFLGAVLPFRRVTIIGAGGGFVFLKTGEHWVFALRVKTMELEKVGRLDVAAPVLSYSLPWPPPFLAVDDDGDG